MTSLEFVTKHLKLAKAIRACLTPDLLHPKFRHLASSNPTTGHCYVASEAFLAFVGGASSGFKPRFIKHEGQPHWFLRHASGRIVDLTAEQFKTPVPYDKARGVGFLTKQPSKRAQVLIQRVLKRTEDRTT